MEQCPFCTYQRKRARGLHRHVLERHTDVMVGGIPMFCWSVGWRWTCWCAKSCLDDYALMDHWQEAGGLLNHILEITLGRD